MGITFASSRRTALSVFASLIFTVLPAALASAQSTEKVTDGTTPSGLASGSPAGSYALSGFESVNPYNGGLNFSLPLLTVGGRGGAGYSIKLRIDQKWMIRKEVNPGTPNQYFPTPRWVDEAGVMEQTYSVGKVTARQSGSRNFVTISPCGQVRQYTLTRLTFTAPDGTEYELRDTLRDGQPNLTTAQTCQNGAYFNRGKVFVTADGTSATFIADYDVTDYPFNNPGESAPSGYMILKDGTRFRVGATNGPPGAIAWMRDRNGNLVSFGYGLDNGSFRLKSVTDSLGRTVTITNSQPTVITYKGFGGVDRTVKVYITSLGTATLRPDFSLRTQDSLFPGLNNPDKTLLSTPQVIDSVELPDGRRYRFKYNSYAELARVVLPTGGAFEYDYAPGLTDGPESGMLTVNVSERQVYRRVVERRVYPGGGTGTAYAVKQVYSRPESSVGNAGYVNVQQCTSASVVGVCDVAATRLTSERHYYYGSPRASFSMQPHQYTSWKDGKEHRAEVYDPQTGDLLRKVENTWEQPVNGAVWPLAAGTSETDGAVRANNPHVTQTLTTLADTNQLGGKTYDYDRYGNQTDVYEYDLGTSGSGARGSFIRRSHTDFVTAANYVDANPNPSLGASLRGLPRQQWISSDPAGNNKAALTTYEYDQFGLDDCPSIVGHDGSYNTGYTTRGNQTSVTRYADAAAQMGALTSTIRYDVAGNPVSSTDPAGNTSFVGYGDSFSDSNNARYTYAFPKGVTSPAPNPVSEYGHPAGTFGSVYSLTSSAVYDFHTGLAVSRTDANGNVTTYDYSDPLERLKRVDRPDGGWTTYGYQTAVNNPSGAYYVETYTALDSSRANYAAQFFDGLGRESRTFSYFGGGTVASGTATYLTVDTQYDALGRGWRASNSYVSSGPASGINPSGRWTQRSYDTLGRPKEVATTADGAKIITEYEGDKVLITDQALRKRLSRADALDRLTNVWEIKDSTPADPAAEGVTFRGVTYTAYHTAYSYDVLENLRTVSQGATQTRTFLYDSLSRLTSVTAPESGTTSYGYDPGTGYVRTKTDARGVTATYTFDHLGRNILISYSDGTPSVKRHYDNPTAGANGLGQPYWTEAVGISSTAFNGYDSIGRPTRYRQVYWVGGVWGQYFDVKRTYDKAGNVLTQTYPSGHTVTYNYDAAGRLGDNGSQLAFTGNLGDGVARTYAAGLSYSEFGGLRQEHFGTQTPLYHKQHYNVRGQRYSVRLSTHSLASNEFDWNRGSITAYYDGAYTWGGAPGSTGSGPDNNGNLLRSETFIPGDEQFSSFKAFRQDYEYDKLNRLKWVAESRYSDWSGQTTPSFKQAYTYDRWGNRTIDATETQVYGQNPGYSIPEPQFDLNPTGDKREVSEPSNRLYAAGDNTRLPQNKLMRYDAAGNLVHDGYTGQGGRTYDAENRMTGAAIDAQGNWAYYTYDADGQRVKRKIANEEWWQVYGMDGELLAEYPAGAAPFLAAKEYGYRGGQLLVTMSSGDVDRLRRFVKNLYYNCLARDPSPAELQQRTNELAQAGAQGGEPQLLTTARAIARSLFESAESASRGRSPEQYVTDLYNAYLQRGPDAGGLTHWVGHTNQFGPGATLNAFEVSTEFATLAATIYGAAAGGEDQRVDTFVRNFYYGAFQREPTAAEAQAGRQRLKNAGATGREQVIAEAQAMAVELIQSTNYNAGHLVDQYVTDLYQAFLQRAPDGPGLTHWINHTNSFGRPATLEAFRVATEYRELAGTLYRETFWLVSDHLGTPRMVVDRTGSLAGVKRHDYLPFGEELYANADGRTPTQGYSVVDNVRQQFTGYERDDEIGLDYARARYFARVQGRFTSPDPLLTSSYVYNPQSFNRYTYVHNNPLNSVDPSGMMAEPCGADNSYSQCGGGGAFWGGGGGFGAEMANHDRYYGGLTSNVEEAVKGYEYRANNGLYGGGGGNSVVAYFDIYYWQYEDGSVETDFRLDGGTVGGYNPLWELTKEVNRRPIGKTFGVLYGSSVLAGAGGGFGLYAYTSSAALTAAETTLANGLYRYSIRQLTSIYRGSQKDALAKLFGGTPEGARSALANLPQRIPPELTRRTLIIYRELAIRAIEAGKPSATQIERLKVIEKALEIMK